MIAVTVVADPVADRAAPPMAVVANRAAAIGANPRWIAPIVANRICSNNALAATIAVVPTVVTSRCGATP